MAIRTNISRKARNYLASLPDDVLGKIGEIHHKGDFSDEMLPFDLYANTRQNIESIADQINKAFCCEIYDGCAVLMRRLIEMLIILSYKKNNLETEIRGNDGNYIKLSGIIEKAVANSTLDLTRNAKKYLDIFREKGNLSAHNPFHNSRKKDLELIQPKFRHLVEELLYKAEIL